MKKNGFTLAEVLITLAIIGVVATMTLPALLTNTAEQQARTGLRKGINTLTEAAQMNQAIAGFDYASLTSTSLEDPASQSLFGLLANRTSIDYAKTGQKRLITQQGTVSNTPSDNMAIFFRDGSALMYPATTVSDENNTTLLDDNLPRGIAVIYDTNGLRGPNIVSNCQGQALGASDDAGDEGGLGETQQTLNNACSGAQRVIRDQFGIRLRGNIAVPNGRAARWAFEN